MCGSWGRRGGLESARAVREQAERAPEPAPSHPGPFPAPAAAMNFLIALTAALCVASLARAGGNTDVTHRVFFDVEIGGKPAGAAQNREPAHGRSERPVQPVLREADAAAHAPERQACACTWRHSGVTAPSLLTAPVCRTHHHRPLWQAGASLRTLRCAHAACKLLCGACSDCASSHATPGRCPRRSRTSARSALVRHSQ